MESRPVFADPSGRRHQVLRLAGLTSIAVLAVFLVAVVVAMTGGPQAPFTQWAGQQAPASSGARHGADQALTGGSKSGAPSASGGPSRSAGTIPAGAGGAAAGQPGSTTGSTSPSARSTSPSPSAGPKPTSTASPAPTASPTASPSPTHGKSQATPHPTPSHK